MRTRSGIQHRIHQTQRAGDKGKTLVKWCKKIMIPHRKDTFIPLNVEQQHMSDSSPPATEPNNPARHRHHPSQQTSDASDERHDAAKASIFERAVELNWLKRAFFQRRQGDSALSPSNERAARKQQQHMEQSAVIVPPALFPSESTLNICSLFDGPEDQEAADDPSTSDITTWDQAEPTTQEAHEYRAFCDEILFGR